MSQTESSGKCVKDSRKEYNERLKGIDANFSAYNIYMQKLTDALEDIE
jgi:hypothetical protein